MSRCSFKSQIVKAKMENCGVVTRAAKRRRLEEQLHERQSLPRRKDRVIRSTDVLVDTALRKVIFPPEEGEEEAAGLQEVKLESVKTEPEDDEGYCEKRTEIGSAGESNCDSGTLSTLKSEPVDRRSLIEEQLRALISQVKALQLEGNYDSFGVTWDDIAAPVLSLEMVGDSSAGETPAETEPLDKTDILVDVTEEPDCGESMERVRLSLTPTVSGADEESSGDDTNPDNVLLLKAQIRELTAKVASLETEKRILHEIADKVISLYVKSWDPVAKHLHLNALSRFEALPVEKSVLRRYAGVTHLTVGMVHGLKELAAGEIEVAGPFHDLQVLDLYRVEGPADSYIEACLAACRKLERLTLPMMANRQEISNVFATLRKRIVEANSHLKEIDFKHLSKCIDQFLPGSLESGRIEDAFIKLIKHCAAHGVRIRNPSTRWPILEYWRDEDKQLLGKCLKSLRMDVNSGNTYFWAVPLEQLESLAIMGTGDWIRDLHQKVEVDGKEPPKKWTRLSRLDVHLVTFAAFTRQDACSLSKFLVERSPNLTELKVTGNEEGASAFLTPTLMRQINLRKLVLNVRGDWSFLSEVWPELTSLEELTLDGSPIPTGDMNQNSTFLQLKSLRKLWLHGLNGMLDSHNKFLCSVLSQMQLTHLFITCPTRCPDATSVPWAEVEILLKGPCGRSIQELSVDGWSFKDRIPGNEETSKLSDQCTGFQQSEDNVMLIE